MRDGSFFPRLRDLFFRVFLNGFRITLGVAGLVATT
jgi:hypothetical protein